MQQAIQPQTRTAEQTEIKSYMTGEELSQKLTEIRNKLTLPTSYSVTGLCGLFEDLQWLLDLLEGDPVQLVCWYTHRVREEFPDLLGLD